MEFVNSIRITHKDTLKCILVGTNCAAYQDTMEINVKATTIATIIPVIMEVSAR